MKTVHRNIVILFSVFASFIVIGSFVAIYIAWPRENIQKSVAVYVSVPLSVSTGRGIANAVTLAFEEYNRQNPKSKIRLEVRDDGDETGAWVGEKEALNAKEAIHDNGTVAYIGTFNSGAAKISMPLLNEAGIVQVSPGNTWPGLTKSGFLPGEPGIFYPTGIRHYFRVCPTDDLQGPAGAKWASDLGFSSVFVLDDGEAYGKGIADIFTSYTEDFGIKVLGRASIRSGADFRTLADAIIKKKPSFIYYGGVTPNGITEFLTVLRSKESSIALMGPDGILEQDFIHRAGVHFAEGVYATTVGAPPEIIQTEKMIRFQNAYRDRFNIEPEVMSAFGYEAALVVLSAIDRSTERTRDSVLAALRNMQTFDGLFGSWSFDENGDTSLALISGNVVVSGKFEYVDTLAVPR